VGQQTAVLKNIADATLFRRQIDALGRIKQTKTVDGDATGIGSRQTGHHIDD